jgi:hypothetical protein
VSSASPAGLSVASGVEGIASGNFRTWNLEWLQRGFACDEATTIRSFKTVDIHGPLLSFFCFATPF